MLYLIAALPIIGIIPALLHIIHIFQLSGYDWDEYRYWLKKPDTAAFLWLAHIVFALCATLLWINNLDALFYVALSGEIITFALPVPLYFRKAKKRLVMTHRAERLLITALVLTVVFPYLIHFTPVIANAINAPYEKHRRNYYINDAKRILAAHKNLITIGITGSYGKTSTKVYLKEILSEKYNVYATPMSFNTPMGIVKAIRAGLSPADEVFVCEMGAKKLGEIDELCAIAPPTNGIITSIGPQHLETFGSVENIVKTKFELANNINGGRVVLNYDNEYIRNAAEGLRKNAVTYSDKTGNGEYKYNVIKCGAGGTVFSVAYDGEQCDFETSLLGAHNVQNLTAAIAMGHSLGVSLAEMRLPIRRLKPAEHRLQLLNTGDGLIIDDAFNSNPAGAKAAVDVLALFTDYVRIVVTPGMVELGEEQEARNTEFGRQIATAADYAVIIGKYNANYIKNGLLDRRFPETKIFMFADVKEAVAYVRRAVSGTKVILLENDLPDNYK
jgi:UDP-N-acetylmuramoyl-tripeptide--D-alanyl-D-alanine ligase